MIFLFFNIALAASKITLYFEKSEFLDHLSVKCFYRELSRDGQKETFTIFEKRKLMILLDAP